MKTFDIVEEIIKNDNIFKKEINEGEIQKVIAGVGVKAAVEAVEKNVANLITQMIHNSGTAKKITVNAIKNSRTYLESLDKLAELAAKNAGYKNFKEFETNAKGAADKALQDASKAMNQEILNTTKKMGATIEGAEQLAKDELNAATKKVGKDAAVVDPLFKNVESNTNLSTKLAKGRAEASKLGAVNLKTFQKEMDKLKQLNAQGPGATVWTKVKTKGGKVPVVKGGKGYSMTIEQLKKYGGNVKNFVFSKRALATLAGLGAIGVIYYLLQQQNPNDLLIIQDEDGNDLSDINNQWAKCIQELLSSKEGTLVRGSNGEISVLVKPSEYPNGVQFYSNGRVLNVATKQMGSWSCKGAMPIIAESEKISLTGLVKEQNDSSLAKDVDTMIDLLDFPVSYSDLVSANNLLKKYASNGKGKQFLSLYQQSGLGGGNLGKTLQYIVTTEPESVQAKNNLTNLYNQILSGKGGGQPTPGGKFGLSHINIKWDGEKKSGGDSAPVVKKKGINYHDCSSKDFPFEFGCISPKIAEIQVCIGVKPSKGYFGPKTVAALKNLEYIQKDVVITKEMYNKIKTLPGCTQATPDKPKTASDFSPKDVPSDALNPQTPPDDQKPSVEKTPEPASPQETGEDIYNRLQRQGFFRGRKIGENNRVPYKGGELPDADIEKLDQFFNENGYRRFKPVEQGKRYGEKWVWRKA